MKISDFKTNSELLSHFGIKVSVEEFINFEIISSIEIPSYLKEDLKFLLANRGDTDLESDRKSVV